jgi:C-terminal processing protease CtpA/Prc
MSNSLFYKLNKTNQEESIENFYQSANTASSANITTRIAERGDKKFGIIRLNMFLPSGDYDLNDYLVAREKIINEVNIIRSFVLENKDKISGIIFDVRANGGGYGSFPQLIANLFTNQFVKNMDVRPLVSQTNSDTFYNLEMSRYFSRKGTKDELSAPFLDTVNEMEKLINDKFTKNLVNNREVLLEAADRFDGDENDALPPNYTKENTDILKPILTDKPIAVLTNSNCYSACDVFTSLFKDYKIARIFGETKHTGGGGANVIEWKDFLIPVVIDERGTKSSIIPNGKPLPKGSEIRFAWNKIKRVNNSKTEQYIEGNGVISDYIYKPTSYDVLNNDENIFNKIMDDMSNYKNPKKFYLNR